MNLSLLKVGHCFHPEAMVMKGHSWSSMMFPAYVGVIRHPVHGVVLFDTGYAHRFWHETTRFPEICYRLLTPMHLNEDEQLQQQLIRMNIDVEDVRYIFISHFHADHISGLRDFPRAKFICSREALEKMTGLGRFPGVLKGYLPRLLPNDFVSRCLFIEDCKLVKTDRGLLPFEQARDIFGDGGLLAISLPGHAVGHYGLLLESGAKGRFLIGDAAWTREAYTEGLRPNRLTHLVLDDGKAYLETLEKLSRVVLANDKLQLIPSHCQKSFQDFNDDC
jgi:glyoxylase-like metal-dependent hydrolase (beta-lactamase superfamily II)